MPITEGPPPRQRLLLRCLDLFERTGFARLSLREIAAGAGTSHAMIIHHFGSRDGLMAAVVDHVEAEQRELLAGIVARRSGLRAQCLEFWQRLSTPELAPKARLFFEIYAQALRGHDWADEFRTGVVEAWERPLTDLFRSHGFTPAQARDRATLSLAGARGLLLDLLLTDDRQRVDAAAKLFINLLTQPAG